VARAALALREDVVFTQKLFGCFAEGFFCFDFSAAEFPAELQIPILGNLLGFREALFLCAGPAVLAGEIAGALPAAAVRAFVDVDLSTEDGVLFRHRGCPPNSFKKRKCVARPNPELSLVPSLACFPCAELQCCTHAGIRPCPASGETFKSAASGTRNFWQRSLQ